ncbi:MAG: PqqD family protein [Deltaproteobacteria bacterium]|nr:PqqD family protein [Deltaproteobacteria bacterium]
MTQAQLDGVYAPAGDIVAREIEGELIIIPLTQEPGDEQDALYTLNDTGRDVWKRLDGAATLQAVAHALAADYDAPFDAIARDILGLAEELLARRLLVAVSSAQS